MSTTDNDLRSNLIVELKSGATARVLTAESAALETGAPTSAGFAPPLGREPVTGTIYTRRSDMPSLERLLEEHRIASAVFEREIEGLSRWRVAGAASIASAVITLGVVLLVSDLVSAVEANAFVALFITLTGAVYATTVASALRK